MSVNVKGFKIGGETHRIDYNGLENKPNIPAAYDDTDVKARLNAIEGKESGWDAKAGEQEINDLQEQIDAIVSAADVRDVVGTYAELLAYDTDVLWNNDVIKVLNDSTHENARSYYRWVVTGEEGAWSYIGSEGTGYTKGETDTLLEGKQDAISDLAAIRTGAGKGDTAYQKPSGGIPKADLADGVQTSLGKADTAYQLPSGGIPNTALSEGVKQSLTRADSAYQKPAGGVPFSDLDASTQTAITTKENQGYLSWTESGDTSTAMLVAPIEMEVEYDDDTPTETFLIPRLEYGV